MSHAVSEQLRAAPKMRTRTRINPLWRRLLPNTTPKGRLEGIDLARALAIIGMFYMHTWGHRLGDNLALKLSDGRASVLFAVLAGVSVILLTRRRTVVQSLVQLIGRGVILTALGLAISLDSVGPIVILVTYGFLYLLVAPLAFRLPLWALTPVAIAASIGAPIFSFRMRQHMPMAQQFGATPTPAMLAEGRWEEAFQLLFFTGLFPVVTWAAIFLWGMVVGRVILGWHQGRWWILVLGAITCAGALTVSQTFLHRTRFFQWYSGIHPDGEPATNFLLYNAFGVTPPDTLRWQLIYVPHSGSIVEIFASVGFSAAVIGACLIVCSRPVAGILLKPLSELGRMPLTAYVGHILAIGYLRSHGHDIAEPAFASANLLVPLVFAWFWFRIFRRGPLEAAMSMLLHKLQPARKPARA